MCIETENEQREIMGHTAYHDSYKAYQCMRARGIEEKTQRAEDFLAGWHDKGIEDARLSAVFAELKEREIAAKDVEIEELRRQVESEQMYSSLRFDELTALRSSIDARVERACEETVRHCALQVRLEFMGTTTAPGFLMNRTKSIVAAVLKQLKG